MSILRVSAEQFRRQLAELLSRAGYSGDQVIIERYGNPVAVLLPYGAYKALKLGEAEINYKVDPSTNPTDLGWPPGFFEETFGSTRDDPIEREPEGLLSPAEQIPRLTAEIERAREDVEIPYETLARGLRDERLRTLREKYADFDAPNAADDAA